MKNIHLHYSLFLAVLLVFNLASCQNDTDYTFEPQQGNQDDTGTNTEDPDPDADVEYLALGDSYSIGQSVCETCRFPEQLKAKYNQDSDKRLSVDVIARTGWRTDDLLNAIDQAKPSDQYELVTLLIGVNNQYQGRSFEQYEQEFPKLLQKAITFAHGDKDKVIVVSIPDYAYTPFGQNSFNPQITSQEIDAYNAFAKATTEAASVKYVDITDITRQGLDQPTLVASDGLHPSELAYARFVERLLPLAKAILNND